MSRPDLTPVATKAPPKVDNPLGYGSVLPAELTPQEIHKIETGNSWQYEYGEKVDEQYDDIMGGEW
jgi:hypothetical protein